MLFLPKEMRVHGRVHAYINAVLQSDGSSSNQTVLMCNWMVKISITIIWPYESIQGSKLCPLTGLGLSCIRNYIQSDLQFTHKNNSFFQHQIDIILRTGRPITFLANAWIIKVRVPCGDKHFLLKVTQLVNRLLFFQMMEIISENAKNIITKFDKNLLLNNDKQYHSHACQ